VCVAVRCKAAWCKRTVLLALVEGRANAFAVRSARAMLPARGAVCGLFCVCVCVFCISNINWHYLASLCNTVAAGFL
jgi:hypothetical protein